MAQWLDEFDQMMEYTCVAEDKRLLAIIRQITVSHCSRNLILSILVCLTCPAGAYITSLCMNIGQNGAPIRHHIILYPNNH